MKTYGEERSFLESCGVRVVELSDESGRARVCLVPAWQGRVMTSTAAGTGGPGYGWINRSLIASGVRKSRFNPFGGEERLWLGPEGGPFSLYFAPGAEQVYANWQVPAALDTEPFRVVGRDARQVRFEAEMSLRNAAGTRFEIGVARRVGLLSHRQAEVSLGRVLPPELALVAYRSENRIGNCGPEPWTPAGGAPSVLVFFWGVAPNWTFVCRENGELTYGRGQLVQRYDPLARSLVEEGIIPYERYTWLKQKPVRLYLYTPKDPGAEIEIVGTDHIRNRDFRVVTRIER